MESVPMQQGEILLYQNNGEKEFVSVVFLGRNFMAHTKWNDRAI